MVQAEGREIEMEEWLAVSASNETIIVAFVTNLLYCSVPIA